MSQILSFYQPEEPPAKGSLARRSSLSKCSGCRFCSRAQGHWILHRSDHIIGFSGTLAYAGSSSDVPASLMCTQKMVDGKILVESSQNPFSPDYKQNRQLIGQRHVKIQITDRFVSRLPDSMGAGPVVRQVTQHTET